MILLEGQGKPRVQAFYDTEGFSIHPTWLAAAMLVFGIVCGCRALKRKESAALFLAVGFLLTAVLSSLRK